MHPFSPDPALAPLSLRAVAFLLDATILIVLALMVGSLAAGSRSTGAVLPVMIALAACYHIGFVAAAGATPGKAAVGLRVAHQGRRPGTDTAVLRFLVNFVLGALFPVGTIANLASMFADGERRTFADRIAGTVVLRAEDAP